MRIQLYDSDYHNTYRVSNDWLAPSLVDSLNKDNINYEELKDFTLDFNTDVKKAANQSAFALRAFY